MVIRRGGLYWVDLGPPARCRPAKCRPVLVVQSDPYDASRLATTVVLVVTSNTNLAGVPGNVFLPAAVTGLARDSVANVTAIVTVNKADLDEPAGEVSASMMREVDIGLRRVLGI